MPSERFCLMKKKKFSERVFAYGFPRLYGGANTELHHQIILWQSMGKEVHLLCDEADCTKEFLYQEMVSKGVVIHKKDCFNCIRPEDPVFAFCSSSFFVNLPEIRKKTKRTIYVNCMRTVSPLEMECVRNGLIAMFLYQNEEVFIRNSNFLMTLNKNLDIRFLTFSPYFDSDKFPFIPERSDKYFGCGRISRSDPKKFSKNTLAIYQRFVSPKPKKGVFLGYGEEVRDKIGTPPMWIRTYRPFEISQQEFYRHCAVILQPSAIAENWPRIGFEAMSSGSVLIVDNAGGWKQMVEHGKTGWLCDSPHDFVHYASMMAGEPGMRDEMALAARERAELLGGYQIAKKSWQRVFDEIDKLPI